MGTGGTGRGAGVRPAAAQKWEASVRNNIGYALHQLGRYEEALAEFNQAASIH